MLSVFVSLGPIFNLISRQCVYGLVRFRHKGEEKAQGLVENGPNVSLKISTCVMLKNGELQS